MRAAIYARISSDKNGDDRTSEPAVCAKHRAGKESEQGHFMPMIV